LLKGKGDLNDKFPKKEKEKSINEERKYLVENVTEVPALACIALLKTFPSLPFHFSNFPETQIANFSLVSSLKFYVSFYLNC